MAEVQAQPAPISESKTENQAEDKDALIVRLDELLEKYLHTLDEYQNTRGLLSKQLSSGYLSLAQANFQNRSATHYGQDSYDERMQAIRKVTVEPTDPEDQLILTIASEIDAPAKVDETDSVEPKDEKAEPPTDPVETKKTAKAMDPLRWFGILVPPALRSAQSNFVSVVEGAIPQLATLAKDLRSQEIEIGRVKKQIKKM